MSALDAARLAAWAAELTAWATISLAVLALAAAIFAGLAWRAQVKEIETLRAQLASQEKLNREQLPVLQAQRDELEFSRWQREAELKERREAYVSRVFLWDQLVGDDGLSPAQKATGLKPSQVRLANLRNVGEMPVYEVTFSWRVRGGMGYQERAELPLMPGPEATVNAGWAVPAGEKPEDVTVVAFIRDANQRRWCIFPDGRHEPIAGKDYPPNGW